MQMEQVQERLSQIEDCIRDAARLCKNSNAPQDLKDSLMELDNEYDEALETVQNAEDESEIVECVDWLEQLGDEALQACRSASNLDPQLQQAVQKAHQELSSLKHQFH